MEKYSKEIDDFLRNIILPKLGMSEYTKENIGEIVDYIFREIEGPFLPRGKFRDLFPRRLARIYFPRF